MRVGVCFPPLFILSFPIASAVFPITAVILLPVETVSKRHFGEPGINRRSGGSILWPRVCCDLEVSNCLHFYKSNLSTHVRVKFIAGYMLAVDSLQRPQSRFSFPPVGKRTFAEKKHQGNCIFVRVDTTVRHGSAGKHVFSEEVGRGQPVTVTAGGCEPEAMQHVESERCCSAPPRGPGQGREAAGGSAPRFAVLCDPN